MLKRAVLLLVTACTPLWAATDPALTEDPVPDSRLPPAIAELTIDSDGSRMSGLIYMANGLGPHPTVLLLHGLPGNEKNLDIAQAARRAGFNVMFFHYRGAWGSEGSYRLTQLPDDVKVALSFLRDNATRYRVDTAKLSLLGHSLGGYASLAAGTTDPALACVGALAPANLGLMAEGLRVNDPDSEAFIRYADTLFMLRDFDGATMREDLLGTPATKLDTRLFAPGLRGKSVLLVTGSDDEVLPPKFMFDPVVAAYRRDPAIHLRAYSIPGDHSFSWSRIELTRLVLDWLRADCV